MHIKQISQEATSSIYQNERVKRALEDITDCFNKKLENFANVTELSADSVPTSTKIEWYNICADLELDNEPSRGDQAEAIQDTFEQLSQDVADFGQLVKEQTDSIDINTIVPTSVLGQILFYVGICSIIFLFVQLLYCLFCSDSRCCCRRNRARDGSGFSTR